MIRDYSDGGGWWRVVGGGGRREVGVGGGREETGESQVTDPTYMTVHVQCSCILYVKCTIIGNHHGGTHVTGNRCVLTHTIIMASNMYMYALHLYNVHVSTCPVASIHMYVARVCSDVSRAL